MFLREGNKSELGLKEPHLLIRPRLLVLRHEPLHPLDAAHFGVDLLQDLGALRQAEEDIFLYEGELDVGREVLQLGELGIRLGEERLLELLAAEGEEGAVLVALGQELTGGGGLPVGQDGDALLVLLQLVALELEVQDCPVDAASAE